MSLEKSLGGIFETVNSLVDNADGEAGDVRRVYLEAALPLCTHLVNRQPNNLENQLLLGFTLGQLGLYDVALPHFEKVAELEPENAVYQNNLSCILFELGRYDDALRHNKRAVELEPENAVYQNNLGVTLIELSLFSDALPHFKKAADLEPDNAVYHANLGDCWRDLGAYNEGIHHLQTAAELEPDNANLQNTLARILNLRGEEGDYARALTHLDKAIKIEPELPNAYGFRADSRRKLAELATGAEQGRLLASALEDITHVYTLVQAKSDTATENNYRCVVRAAYNEQRFGMNEARQPLDDQSARQAVLQHPLVQQGIQEGKIKADYVLKDFKAPI